jgi:hypothetical protein
LNVKKKSINIDTEDRKRRKQKDGGVSEDLRKSSEQIR